MRTDYSNFILSTMLFIFFLLESASTVDDELMGYEIDDGGNVINDIDSHPTYEEEVPTSVEKPLMIGPHFDFTGFRNVTTLVGNTAYLKCRVRNIGNRTVSWIRHRDIHLLCSAEFAYTSDNRFHCIHNVDAEEWILKVGNEVHNEISLA